MKVTQRDNKEMREEGGGEQIQKRQREQKSNFSVDVVVA